MCVKYVVDNVCDSESLRGNEQTDRDGHRSGPLGALYVRRSTPCHCGSWGELLKEASP